MLDEIKIPQASDPEDALTAVVALRAIAEKLERKAVKQALQQGWTWEQIAEALGVTRQAAHKRHAKANVKTRRRKRPTPNISAMSKDAAGV